MEEKTVDDNRVNENDDDSGSKVTDLIENTSATREAKKGWRFWLVILAVGISSVLPALETTVTSTALPTIIQDLGGANLYIWPVNAYNLSMTVFQPLYGQTSDIFGRRWPMLIALALFILGSGICGGATNMSMLIAGRTLQGVGAGGINVLGEIIVCDLVPLRERGQYIAMVMGTNALGTAAGPIFGGLIVQHSTWRWVFYLNLPLGGLALAMVGTFLQVKYKKDNIWAQLRRIDWAGNVIFTAAMVAILIPLSTASTEYSWSAWQVLVPLLLGLMVGLPIFVLFEGSKLCKNPTMPLRLFGHRTSAVAFTITFLHALVTMWAIYFLPVYFQGVHGATPARSGVMLMPMFTLMLPFVIVGGKMMEVTGKYRPIHFAGLAAMTLGLGLFSLLTSSSPIAAWVCFQIIEAAGIGFVVGVLLPAVQAPLPESDVALSTSTWSFVRCFGMVWGVAIPSTIFNNRSAFLAQTLQNSSVASQLTGGRAYEHATKAFLSSLPPSLRGEVRSIFTQSVREVWYAGTAFVGFACLLSLLEADVELRKEVETEYGLEERKKEAVVVRREAMPS